VSRATTVTSHSGAWRLVPYWADAAVTDSLRCDDLEDGARCFDMGGLSPMSRLTCYRSGVTDVLDSDTSGRAMTT
jgi:hypothetical protein